VGPLARFDLLIRANRVNERINLFLNKDQDYRVGIYGELGRGAHAETLVRDLMCFLREEDKTISYWAVFYDTEELTEDQFYERVQQELSYISAASPVRSSLDMSKKQKDIYLNIDGVTLFVSGYHQNSDYSSHRFHYATLVFSLASGTETAYRDQTH
jgi:FPC/CPF motif-containing protein YcgG